MSDLDDSDKETSLPLETISTWKVTELKTWLEEKGLKKSGLKPVLIKRVYRAMQNLDSESEYDASDDEQADISKGLVTLSTIWTTANTDNLPDINDKDIENYFLFQRNPTSGKRAKFQRHLVKARKLCNEHYLSEVKFSGVSEESEICYVKANCKPSMRSTVKIGNKGETATLYSLNVCLAVSTGHVIWGYCNCKAGVCGLCAHVGGLLFTLVRLKNACTSKECTWDRPRPVVRKPSPKRVGDIKFFNAPKDTQCEKIHSYPGTFQASACKDPDIFLNDLLEGLEFVNPGCVLYKTLMAKQVDISPFISLFTPTFFFRDQVNLKSEECVSVFQSFVSNLMVTDEIADNLEVGTRGQVINKNWKEARSFIITASNMGKVCKRQKNEPDNLIAHLRGYKPTPENVKSLQYGRRFEKKAIKEYSKQHSKICGNDVIINDQGLQVDPKLPYIGASVDGTVKCQKCGIGLVEVKCPYGTKLSKWRNMAPEDCAKDPKFFCNLDENVLRLRSNHNYMFQIYGQMAVCKMEWVDFVVWTKKGINCERIHFNESFWKSEMLPKIKNFYAFSFVPELFTERVKRGVKLF